MENNSPTISKELQEQIEREAEALKRKMPDNYFPTNYKYYEGYIAGATAYAHYKERFEQAKKALEGILLFCELDGKPCDGYRFREEAVKAKALLDSWKEEGKGGNNE